MARLAGPRALISIYEGLSDLPHFNPDLDRVPIPAAVSVWRREIADADGLVFSTPEYAHGVPGSLKNALDWLVGGVEIVDQPTAVINPRPGSVRATASLVETLSVIGARIIPQASVSLPLETNRVDENSLLADAPICEVLRSALDAFLAAIERQNLRDCQ